MTTINVVTTTQIIHVDPVSGTVSVVASGPQGPAGVAGPAGPMGTGLTVKGSDEYADIIAKVDPEPGDLWIQTDTAGGGVPGDGVVWDGDSWTNVGAIRGPAGTDGADGTDGAEGFSGVDGGAPTTNYTSTTPIDGGTP